MLRISGVLSPVLVLACVARPSLAQQKPLALPADLDPQKFVDFSMLPGAR